MEPGVYFDLTNDEYHGGPGTNKGLLDVVARSPLHAKALLDRANDDRPEPTPAMVLGTALHTLVLEPELFAEQYVCELTQADAPHAIADREELVRRVEALNAGRLPKLATGGTKAEQVQRILDAYAEQPDVRGYTVAEMDGMKAAELKAELETLNRNRTGLLSTSGSMDQLAAILATEGQPVTLWQDVRSRWRAENEGYIVLSVDTYEQLLGMRDSIMAHPAASALLKGSGVAEASVYWTDPATGELCRCRPDWWRADGVIVDLKSTEDASPEGFAKSLVNYRYHVQAPWYLAGTQAAWDAGHTIKPGCDASDFHARPHTFAFIAVEKRAPYAVAVYVLDSESHEIGSRLMRADLDMLAQCRATGIWPGYGDKLQQLGVPQYYLMRHAHLLGAA